MKLFLKRYKVYHCWDKCDKDIFIKHYNSLFIANIVTKSLERRFKRPDHTIILTDENYNQVLNSSV
jgi:hypothetical protein